MDNKLFLPCDVSQVSDGYHTFEELYDHRCLLFLSLLKFVQYTEGYHTLVPWYSLKHSDESVWDGWFIAGMHRTDNSEDTQQITYHLPIKFLELVESFELKELDKAPEWDGHTSADVIERLTALISKQDHL